MIGKHLFYTMVPLSLGAGSSSGSWPGAARAARLLAACSPGALAWTALAFWIARLVQASS